MAKSKPVYTFVDPNPPQSVEALLRKILLEKLRAQTEANA